MSAPGETQQPRPPALWRIWWLAARPATLFVALAPVLLASALAASIQHFAPALLAWATIGAIAIQIGTNLFNDWADFRRGADTAARLGPLRVTQQGLLPAKVVLSASLACFAFACVAGLFLLSAGGWPIFAVGVCSILAGLAYTGGPYPLAYHGLGDIFAFVFFGPVALCSTYYLHTGEVSQQSIVLGLGAGAFSAAVLMVNNLRDRFTDARAGKQTLAVRLGAPMGRCQYVGLVAMPYLLILLAVVCQWLPPACSACALSLPWASRVVRHVLQQDGAALNPSLGATARLELMWATGVALGLFV